MLAPTLPEAAQQHQFAQLYAQYQGDWASFWAAAEQAFGAAAAAQLQLDRAVLLPDGQQRAAGLGAPGGRSRPAHLSPGPGRRGYYDPAKWAPLIGASIPPGIPGADADEQAANYAQLLAAQVRIAFPTAVLADQVPRGILPVAGTAQIAESVASFLTAHQGEFEIGASRSRPTSPGPA